MSDLADLEQKFQFGTSAKFDLILEITIQER